MEQKDDILEMQIKFKETLLAQFKRISDASGMSEYTQQETVDRLLDELSKLYKMRKKN